MVSEPDIGRCVCGDTEPLRGVDTGQCANEDTKPQTGVDTERCANEDAGCRREVDCEIPRRWERRTSTNENAGPGGEWIVRSHNDRRGGTKHSL